MFIFASIMCDFNKNAQFMENLRLKLPIGIQTFETIRREGYVYVDKTRFLVGLIEKGQIYFLARPRRFGKSLAISTFDSLFSGKKELFNGLYAEDFVNRPDFKPNPVIWLDMSKTNTIHGMDGIEKSIVKQVRDIADFHDVTLSNSNTSGNLLDDLIVRTAQKYNDKVVILLDEYDKPYTDFVNDPVMADEIRKLLRNFYVQIKSNDRRIRFTFITGVSKFTKMGVFSTMNTPLDISMMPEYGEICGYTEEEIIRYFPDYMEETANYMEISTDELIKRMRDFYNGFSFDRYAKTRLYNPYSTLSFFAEKAWDNYWIDSGGTKMIADYLKYRHLTVEQFRNMPIPRDIAKNPGEIDTAPPYSFLYQSGYLTLRPGANNGLALDYPNTEVLQAMSKMLIQNMVGESGYISYYNLLTNALVDKNAEKLIQVFNRLLARIPYDDYALAMKQDVMFEDFKFPAQEWLYRTAILSMALGCGVDVSAEVHSSFGRSDLAIAYSGVTWVIEIKVAYGDVDTAVKAEEAYRQIEEKNYAKLYPDAICIGLAINDSKRQIAHWKTAEALHVIK